MIALLRPIIARLLGAWIAGVCTWLAVHFGIVIPDEAQTKAIEALVLWVIPTLLTFYSLAHKWISAKVNPGDAATPKMAEKEKSENTHLP